MNNAQIEVEYCNQAVADLTNYIDHATRHLNLSMKITDAKYHQVNFEVIDSFLLSVVSEEDTFTGRIKGSPDDIYIKDNPEKYSIACADLCRQESTDEGIYRRCRNEIAQFDFGHFHKHHTGKFLIHTNKKKVIHHSGCPVCERAGQIRCSNCQSTGYEVCNACGGSGETSCLYCSGAGYQTEIRSYRDSDGDYQHEEIVIGCTCYNGSIRCGTCGGHGKFQCTSCEDGFIDCHKCDATGWLSKVNVVQMWFEHTVMNTDTTNSADTRIKSFSKHFIEVHGYASLLNNQATLLRRHVRDDQANARFQIHYDFSAPCATLMADLHFENQSQPTAISFFGQHHYLLDAGCILDPVLKTDIESLVSVTKNLFSVFEERLQQHLLSTIQPLLASPVLLEILNAHIDNRTKSNSAIARSSHNSLSEEKVGTTIYGTRRALALINCRRLFEGLLMSIGSYTLLYCIAYFYFQWCGNVNVFNTLFFGEKAIATYALSSITLSFTISVLLSIEEIRYQRALSKNFADNCLLLQRLGRSTMMGSFWGRTSTIIFLMLSYILVF